MANNTFEKRASLGGKNTSTNVLGSLYSLLNSLRSIQTWFDINLNQFKLIQKEKFSNLSSSVRVRLLTLMIDWVLFRMVAQTYNWPSLVARFIESPQMPQKLPSIGINTRSIQQDYVRILDFISVVLWLMLLCGNYQCPSTPSFLNTLHCVLEKN